MSDSGDFNNPERIEKFILSNKPVDMIEPMSPPDQMYASKKLKEFKESKLCTICGVGFSGYTCYAFYKSKKGKNYFVTFSSGKVLSYAELG
jgi:hypothetical protein